MASESPPLPMLAVLAIDASETSVDALLPVFSKGSGDRELERLKVHATRTASMVAMLEAVKSRIATQQHASPAVIFFSQLLQLEKPLDAVNVTMWLCSEERNSHGVPRFQGTLRIDSKIDRWWSINLTRVDEGPRSTFVNANGLHGDSLRIGSTTLEELPHWLARAARKLQFTWRRSEPRTSLRGKKREQFVDWLFSGRA